jgi:hypothetical protein
MGASTFHLFAFCYAIGERVELNLRMVDSACLTVHHVGLWLERQKDHGRTYMHLQFDFH